MSRFRRESDLRFVREDFLPTCQTGHLFKDHHARPIDDYLADKRADCSGREIIGQFV
jgi:hypothetical protein